MQQPELDQEWDEQNNTALQHSEIESAIYDLFAKWIIAFTWPRDEHIYIKHSQLPH